MIWTRSETRSHLLIGRAVWILFTQSIFSHLFTRDDSHVASGYQYCISLSVSLVTDLGRRISDTQADQPGGSTVSLWLRFSSSYTCHVAFRCRFTILIIRSVWILDRSKPGPAQAQPRLKSWRGPRVGWILSFFPPPSISRLPLLLRSCYTHSLPFCSFLLLNLTLLNLRERSGKRC